MAATASIKFSNGFEMFCDLPVHTIMENRSKVDTSTLTWQFLKDSNEYWAAKIEWEDGDELVLIK